MSVYLGVSAGIFSLYVLINLWAMHSQRLNRPNYVLTELDSLVGIRHNSLARLSARFTTFVEKHHIRRIQVSHECLTLFTDTNDFVDIWLCDEYLISNASRAKTLFPDAEFVRTFA